MIAIVRLFPPQPRQAGFTSPGCSAEHGFTLVELMVVIAVMAMIAGTVVMTIGSRDAGPSDVANRFASRIAAARDEAITGARPMAVWVTPSGYGFERFESSRWHRFEGKPFDARDWGEGLTVGGSAGNRTRVGFDTIGLPDSAFSIVIGDGETQAEVAVAANGDVAVK